MFSNSTLVFDVKYGVFDVVLVVGGGSVSAAAALSWPLLSLLF